MGQGRVVVTGGFGSVGAHVVEHLTAQGYDVSVLDVDGPASRRKQAQLAAVRRFDTAWCDLTDPVAVRGTIAAAQPDAVVHVAAVIAPMAYVKPELARRVNVDGTAHLLAAVAAERPHARVVFTSSYYVHGPNNPHRGVRLATGATPVAPVDTYGKHKVEGERLLAASGLEGVSVRLPAVMPVDLSWGTHPAFLRFGFMLPRDRHEHALDARDAALALAHAATASDAAGRTFDVGGPEVDCKVTGAELGDALNAARGFGPLPDEAYPRVDPSVDEAWPSEWWIDTAESEAVLRYQTWTLADHVQDMRRRVLSTAKGRRLAFAWPLLRRWVVSRSPWWRTDRPVQRTPMWDRIRAEWDLPPDVA